MLVVSEQVSEEASMLSSTQNKATAQYLLYGTIFGGAEHTDLTIQIAIWERRRIFRLSERSESFAESVLCYVLLQRYFSVTSRSVVCRVQVADKRNSHGS